MTNPSGDLNELVFLAIANRRIVRAKQSLRLECFAHSRIYAVHFAQVWDTTTAEALCSARRTYSSASLSA